MVSRRTSGVKRSRKGALPSRPRARPVVRRASVPGFISSGIYKFKRTTSWEVSMDTNEGFKSPSGVVVYGQGISILHALSASVMNSQAGPFISTQVPSYLEFSALFDQYRIDSVTVKMIFTGNNSSINTSTSGLPLLQVCTDFDDVTPPIVKTELQQRPDTKYIQFSAKPYHSVTYKPKATFAIDGGGNGLTIARQWIDTATVDVPYKGLKIFYDLQQIQGTGNIGNISFYVTYNMSFKGVR